MPQDSANNLLVYNTALDRSIGREDAASRITRPIKCCTAQWTARKPLDAVIQHDRYPEDGGAARLPPED
jgi:hypothetical protein